MVTRRNSAFMAAYALVAAGIYRRPSKKFSGIV